MTTTHVLLMVAMLLMGIAVGWRIATARGGATAGNSGGLAAPPRSSVTIFVLLSFVLVLAAGWLIASITKDSSPGPEIQMGLVVVGAITSLMTILFILAAGFSSIGLADEKQPLGLPEGSIRAMIALVLIMVFIIFGIYLFRMVGTGSATFIAKMDTVPDPKIYGPDKLVTWEKDPEGKYVVWVVSPMGQDAKSLAQQLITTVGTLVVAVAGFYFGSTAVSSAVTARNPTTAAPSTPTIVDMTPREGAKGKTVDLEIKGAGFKGPRDIRLKRGEEAMIAQDVLASATRIRCQVKIDKESGAKWDLVIENDDGAQARLGEAFSIKDGTAGG
jgi:flagellar biogenesis protein FliO